MTELSERIEDKRPPAGLASDWVGVAPTKEVFIKDAVAGSEFIKHLKKLLDTKFQNSSQLDYEKDASERERAFAGGYRKALKDIYRLLQLDI